MEKTVQLGRFSVYFLCQILLNCNIKRVKYMLTHYRKVQDLINGVLQERL